MCIADSLKKINLYEDRFLKLADQMEKIYPNQPFSFDVYDVERLDEVLMPYHYGLVYYTHDCCCWRDNHPPPTLFVIENKNRRHITYRDFYDAVMKNWDTKKSCDHSCLEDIEITNNCMSLFLSS